MHFSLLAAVALGALPLLAAAAPVQSSDVAAAAKAPNMYLVTCAYKAPKGDDDDDSPPVTGVANFTAVAYFKNPIDPNDSSKKGPKPDKAALVSQPPTAWEGVKLVIKAWKKKQVITSITGGANTLAKGGLAGTAMLDTEDYACFRDGTTKIRIREDDDFRGNCVADYWCAGLGGSSDDA